MTPYQKGAIYGKEVSVQVPDTLCVAPVLLLWPTGNATPLFLDQIPSTGESHTQHTYRGESQQPWPVS